jgi:hypothetical protein
MAKPSKLNQLLIFYDCKRDILFQKIYQRDKKLAKEILDLAIKKE